jgi:hypothetical protein
VHRAAVHLQHRELLRAGSCEGRQLLGVTGEGVARWQVLSRQVSATSQELLGALDPADLAAAVRVLQTVTSKAPAIRARWQQARARPGAVGRSGPIN